jgi:hypothetical protein
LRASPRLPPKCISDPRQTLRKLSVTLGLRDANSKLSHDLIPQDIESAVRLELPLQNAPQHTAEYQLHSTAE